MTAIAEDRVREAVQMAADLVPPTRGGPRRYERRARRVFAASGRHKFKSSRRVVLPSSVVLDGPVDDEPALLLEVARWYVRARFFQEVLPQEALASYERDVRLLARRQSFSQCGRHLRRILPIRVGANNTPARAPIQAVHQIHAPAERVAGSLQERHDVVLADVLRRVGRDAARLRDDRERVSFVEYFQRRRRLEDDGRRWCGRWGERLDCACSHEYAVVAHQCAAAMCRIAVRANASADCTAGKCRLLWRGTGSALSRQ